MVEVLNNFIKINKIPNLLIYGDSGVGKKQIVKDFLNKIYKTQEEKLKYILNINCCEGTGIKLIREDLKFFGKKIVNNNIFKTVIFYNGDKLTIDAQCALRRSIEIYSKTTRFIIILDDKNKLLKPLVSRFCDIYIHNINNYYVKNNKNINLYNDLLFLKENIENNNNLVSLSEILYDKGYSLFDVTKFYKETDTSKDKYFYLLLIEIFRKNIFNEKIIIYFTIYLFKMRPSIDLMNINSY